MNNYFDFLNKMQLRRIKFHALFKLLIQLLLNKIELKNSTFFLHI